MLLCDGVEQEEYEALCLGFEDEGAEIVATSPHEYLTVETVDGSRQGRDVFSELPLEGVNPEDYAGLIIPDGVASTELLRKDGRAIDLIKRFYELRRPIFASGRAVDLLYDAGAIPPPVHVREEAPMEVFIEQAIAVLCDNTSTLKIISDDPWYFPLIK